MREPVEAVCSGCEHVLHGGQLARKRRIAAGIAAFVWPGITALAFVYLIAAWALVTGVAEIAFALAIPDTLAHPWLAVLAGIISMVFGFVMAAMPRRGRWQSLG